MHRIDGAGHVDHMFVAEDPATLRPPTEITPEIMNAFQEELATFVEWAEITLAKGDNSQLKQALLAKFCRAEQTDNVITGAGLVVDHTDQMLLRQAITKMIQAGQHSVIFENVTFADAVTGTGKAVYWDSGNSRFDLALADGSVKQECCGFADVPNACIYAFGKAALFAGLTPGRYYLNGTTAGAITKIAPANIVSIGIAETANEVFVDIDLTVVTVTANTDSSFSDNSAKPASTSWIRGAIASMIEAIAIAAGFVVSFGTNSYVKFPSWLGSVIIQVGSANANANGAAAAVNNFPIAFTDYTKVQIIGSYNAYGSGFNVVAIGVGAISNSQFSASSSGAVVTGFRYIAFGK